MRVDAYWVFIYSLIFLFFFRHLQTVGHGGGALESCAVIEGVVRERLLLCIESSVFCFVIYLKPFSHLLIWTTPTCNRIRFVFNCCVVCCLIHFKFYRIFILDFFILFYFFFHLLLSSFFKPRSEIRSIENRFVKSSLHKPWAKSLFFFFFLITLWFLSILFLKTYLVPIIKILQGRNYSQTLFLWNSFNYCIAKI